MVHDCDTLFCSNRADNDETLPSTGGAGDDDTGALFHNDGDNTESLTVNDSDDVDADLLSSKTANDPETTTSSSRLVRNKELCSGKSLRIFNWNCTSMPPSRVQLLVKELHKLDVAVACLQEVRWHPIHNPPSSVVGQYRVYYSHHDYANSDHARGGVAILVRSDLIAFERNDLSTSLCTKWLEVHLEDKSQFVIGTAYVPPYTQDTALIPELTSALDKLPKLAILCGDFNARHLVWDPDTPPDGRSKNAGDHLETLRLKHDLVLLNPLMHTYSQGGHQSTLDLALATPAAAILTDMSFPAVFPESSHRPILLDVSLASQCYEPDPPPERWRCDEEKSEAFMLATELEFGRISPSFCDLSPEEQVKRIQRAFENAASSTLGRIQPRVNRRPGMTAEVLRLKKAYHKALHFYNNSRTSQAKKRRCDNARKAYEDALDEALSRTDVTYMGAVSSQNDSQVWKNLTAYTGKKCPPLYPPLNGGKAVTNPQKASALLRVLSGICAPQSDNDARWDSEYTAYVRQYLAENENDFNDLSGNEEENSAFTMNELCLGIDKLKHSSPGSDGIPSWFFKKCGQTAKECILAFVNTSFATGILPDACKEGDIVPIPKPGRDHRVEKNYRPISLLLIISRLMESMIHRRLYYWAEQNSHIPTTQAAYRAYSNSVHPLIRLTQDVHSAFNTSKQTFAVRLDLKKAFDSINGEYLCLVLHRMGLRGKMLAWIRSFLSDRRYRVVRPSTTEYVDFGIGVPQGSGLSPLLFILFISECSHLLHCSHAEYADDITLWYSHSCPHTIRAMLNEDLRTIEAWARQMRLQFGDKNEYFIFHAMATRPLDIEQAGGLQFYASKLTKATEFVLLGVHFDHALTFKRLVAHIAAAACNKTSKHVTMCPCCKASEERTSATGALQRLDPT